MRLRQTVITDLESQADLLRRRAHGLIEVRAGEFQQIRLRRLPKLASLPEVWWWGRWVHARHGGDCCWLYYNQPRRYPNFLTVQYVVSDAQTSYATIRRAAGVLDAIAEIKRSDAIVCEASNLRISHRLLTRWGWQRQEIGGRRRHYIKRFYGRYPAQVSQSRADRCESMAATPLPVDDPQPVLPCF